RKPVLGFHPPMACRIAFLGRIPWEKQACGGYKSPCTRAQAPIIRTAKYDFCIMLFIVVRTYVIIEWSLGKRQSVPKITRCSAFECARSDRATATGAL